MISPRISNVKRRLIFSLGRDTIATNNIDVDTPLFLLLPFHLFLFSFFFAHRLYRKTFSPFRSTATPLEKQNIFILGDKIVFAHRAIYDTLFRGYLLQFSFTNDVFTFL